MLRRHRPLFERKNQLSRPEREISCILLSRCMGQRSKFVGYSARQSPRFDYIYLNKKEVFVCTVTGLLSLSTEGMRYSSTCCFLFFDLFVFKASSIPGAAEHTWQQPRIIESVQRHSIIRDLMTLMRDAPLRFYLHC